MAKKIVQRERCAWFDTEEERTAFIEENKKKIKNVEKTMWQAPYQFEEKFFVFYNEKKSNKKS